MVSYAMSTVGCVLEHGPQATNKQNNNNKLKEKTNEEGHNRNARGDLDRSGFAG